MKISSLLFFIISLSAVFFGIVSCVSAKDNISVSIPSSIAIGSPLEFTIKVPESVKAKKIYSFFTRQDYTVATGGYSNQQLCDQALRPENKNNNTCYFCHFQEYNCPTQGNCDNKFSSHGFSNAGQTRAVFIIFTDNDMSKCATTAKFDISHVVTVGTPIAGGSSAASSSGSNLPITPVSPTTITAIAGGFTDNINGLLEKLGDYWIPTLAGSIALITLMIGGIILITAGGDDAKIKQGNQAIVYSIVGIIVVLSSVIIISVVNGEINTFFR